MVVSQLLEIIQIKIKCVSKRYVLRFLLLELKQELIQGIIIACIIHKVRLDNQNNFFRILKKKACKWVYELLKYSLCGTMLEGNMKTY